VKNRIVRPNK